ETMGSFIAEGLDGFKPAGAPGWDQAAQNANDPGAAADQDDVARDDECGQIAKTIDGRGEKLESRHPIKEMQELIAIRQGEHAQPRAGKGADGADQSALAQENQTDLPIARPEGFQHSDLASFLNHKRNQGAEDAKGGDDHDEEEQVKHDVLFDHQG